MQTYVPELKQSGVGLSCSLVVHGLLLSLLFWSSVRERAQQNTWHQVDAPVFSMLLTPAATAAAAETVPQEVVTPPPVPIVERAEIVLEQAKPVRIPQEKPPEVKPAQKPMPRTHTTRPVRRDTAMTAPVDKNSESRRDNAAQNVNQAGNAQAAAPDAGPRSNAQQKLSGEASDGEKQAYLARIRIAVEKNKVYPSRARRMKIQGNVQVEIAIDAAGNITAARMVRSSGEASLDEAALDTARKARSSGPPPAGFGRIIVMQIDFQLNKR